MKCPLSVDLAAACNSHEHDITSKFLTFLYIKSPFIHVSSQTVAYKNKRGNKRLHSNNSVHHDEDITANKNF